MNNKFDAAITLLRVFADNPSVPKGDKESFLSAQPVLEAAGTMNSEWWLMTAGQLSGINFSNQHPEVALVWLKQTFRALLDALPDGGAE